MRRYRCVGCGQGGDQALVDGRGGLDLHVLVACEQGLEPMVPHIGE